MATIFNWLGHLVEAVVFAVIVQLAARLLHRALPQVSRGLYQAVGLRGEPDEWQTSFARFFGLFLLAIVLGSWLGLGGLLNWALLAWFGYNVYRAYSSPQQAAKATGGV